MAKDPEISESPRIDQGTQGTGGAVEIPALILQKIDKCQIFVADVSICYNGPLSGRLAPNPNVLFETGYAVARLGWERVILVLNESSGTIKQLPFDLEKRQTILYSPETAHSSVKDYLKSQFQRSIVEIAKLPELSNTYSSISDKVCLSLENGTQSPKKVIREFGEWILEELIRLEIDTTDPSSFLSQLEASLPILESMWKVCDTIEATDRTDQFVEFSSLFEFILNRYDVRLKSGIHGYRETTFDWWKFHGNELILLPVAAMLRSSDYDSLQDFLGQAYIQELWNRNGIADYFDFRSFSDHIAILDSFKQKWFNPQAHFMHERVNKYAHSDVDSIVDADFVLSLISTIRSDPGYRRRWLPELCFYSARAPRILSLATSEKHAHRIAPLFDANGVAELKQKLQDGFTELDRVRSRSDYRRFNFESLINAIGTRK